MLFREVCKERLSFSSAKIVAAIGSRGIRQDYAADSFVGRSEAIRFAMPENGCPPWAVIMVPGVLELKDNLPLKNAA